MYVCVWLRVVRITYTGQGQSSILLMDSHMSLAGWGVKTGHPHPGGSLIFTARASGCWKTSTRGRGVSTSAKTLNSHWGRVHVEVCSRREQRETKLRQQDAPWGFRTPQWRVFSQGSSLVKVVTAAVTVERSLLHISGQINFSLDVIPASWPYSTWSLYPGFLSLFIILTYSLPSIPSQIMQKYTELQLQYDKKMQAFFYRINLISMFIVKWFCQAPLSINKYMDQLQKISKIL